MLLYTKLYFCSSFYIAAPCRDFHANLCLVVLTGRHFWAFFDGMIYVVPILVVSIVVKGHFRLIFLYKRAKVIMLPGGLLMFMFSSHAYSVGYYL